jgi:hypothetical protein
LVTTFSVPCAFLGQLRGSFARPDERAGEATEVFPLFVEYDFALFLSSGEEKALPATTVTDLFSGSLRSVLGR